MAQGIRSCQQLFLQYFLIFLLFVLRIHVLPRKLPEEEVNKHIKHTFQVIPPTLLNTEVSVDRGIPCCTSEIFIIFVCDMASIQLVLLGQAEVNDVYHITFFILANQKVVRLYVPMDKTLRVNILNPLQDLQPDHYDGLEWKRFVVLLEKGLEGASQDLHDHDTFLSFSEIFINLNSLKLTLRIPRSLDRPSLSNICRIFDSQQSCGFFDVVFSILMANFSLRLLKAVKISPKAPEPNFCPTILYYPYVFIGNQNTDSSMINIINKIPTCPVSPLLKKAIGMKRLLSITIIVIITYMSRYRGIGLQGKEEESMMQGLIKELLKVWSNKAVQDRYQNYFLIYLDTLSERDAQMAIAKEIKLTLENKSHFFKINLAMSSHRGIVSKLQRFIDEINRNNKNSVFIGVAKFASVLELLRNNNLEVAQAVLSFNYECLGNGKHPLQLIIGNNYLFEQLNADNEMLKKSFLEDYIAFSNSYDPFLLYHYENSKKMVPKKAQNAEIQQLFNLSVSRAYKFMKAQQEILQFLSGKIPTKFVYGKTKRTHYNLIDELSSPDSTNYKSNVFKLQNNAYIRRYELNQQDNEYIQRTRTEQSPLKGIIFNTKNAKKTLGAIYNRHQLPRIQHIKKTDITPLDSPINNYQRAQARKFSEQEATNKYTFKIRRRASIRNNQSSTIFAQRPRGYIQSINRIMRRQEEFLKHSEHSRRDLSDKQGGQSLYMKLNQAQNMQASQYDDDQQRQPPLSNKHTQQIRNLKVQPLPIDKKEPKQESKPEQNISPSKAYRNFKLKAGNMKVPDIFIFLKELNIKPYYRSMFQVQNWEHLLKNNQYYFHKFYIDDVLQAISLCCGLPDSNILIKYWAPLQTCDKQMSSFLFKRYLQHIQRNSICTAIYYSLGQIPELVDNGFVKYNQKILAKYRSIPQQVDSFNYFPFLCVNFSIVAVPKSVAKQDLQNITVKLSDVYPFNEKEFVCFNYLLITNKIINLASGFSAFGTYTPNIKNFKDVATKLIKQEIFENGYNTQLKISNSNLLTLRLRHPVHSPFFVAKHPLVKFIGEEVYSDSQSLVASLQLVKNVKLYFGKGFTSITSLMTVIKNRAPSKNQIEYCVNMFRKRMRGRLMSTNLRDEHCFGDFEVVFQWIDFLKGKVQQDLKEFELFGQTSFYCIIQIQNQYIMGFEIKLDSFS